MTTKDPKFEALEAVYTALKTLNQQERQEIVASVFALLGAAPAPPQISPAVTPSALQVPQAATAPVRPKGLMEMVQERHPGTNAQRIAVFAYYRERHEGLPRFSREDLKPYFGKAHIKPPENFDRDFTTALQKGWLHEDSADSYITTKGIEVVEASFEGERSYEPRAKNGRKRKSRKPTTRRKPLAKSE